MPSPINAGALNGVEINNDALSLEGQSLVFDSVTGQYIAQDVVGIGVTEVDDANYSVLVSDRIVVITALTAPRTITLPNLATGVNQSFIIKDESGNAASDFITIDVDGGGTIDGLSSIDLRTDYGMLSVYFDGTNYYTWDGTKNSGQVKINTGNSVKPSLTWTAPEAGDFKDIQYDLPLGLSAVPTTSWPRNAGPSPTDSQIYDDTNETFIENTVPGQINVWRMIFDYSGKSQGAETGIEIRIRNTLSGFSNTQTVYLPSERTSGQFAVEMTTIADMASLPSPWGTGQGYVFDIAADDAITIELDSLVRINTQLD